jgi:hypothetical protein
MKQSREVPLNRNEIKIFIKQHNFFAGILNLEKRIFFHIPRSSKNLFHLFGFSGLGINEEILLRNDFDTIKIKFQDAILETTRLKWLKKGITSPYCNFSVDKQIILDVNKINMEDTAPEEVQTNLFNKVI